MDTPTEILSDNQTAQVLADLGGRDGEAGARALAGVLEARDPRFIAVLIEILRANEIGLALGVDYSSTVEALEALSGQSLGANWPAWVEWYGGTDLAPPPGFTGWKGQLLSFIDLRFADFLTDEAASRIRVEEILWGGVTVDGIPALDQAEMIPAGEAGYLLPEEPVFGVAIAYDGRGSDGETYTFGSSGFLFRSNKLMYDRQTRTLWNQLSGEPVLGELAATDVRLSLLPVVLTSWSHWQSQHPDTVTDERGREWQVTEEGLQSPDGLAAPRLSGHLSYWFGWFAFFPNTLVYEGQADT